MTHFRGTDSLFVKSSIRQHTQKTAGGRKKLYHIWSARDLAKFV